MRLRSSEAILQPTTVDASDPLASIISLLRPQTVLSKIVSGAGKWSIRKPRYEDPAFCLLLDGSCFLDLDGVGALELKEGDFVGEMGLLSSQPRNADVVANGYCHLLMLSRRDFRDLLAKRPAVRAEIEAVAARRIAETESQAAS